MDARHHDQPIASSAHGISRRGSLAWLGTIAWLGTGGLGLARATRGGRAAAQEADSAATPTDLPPAVAEWVAGWEALDAARLTSGYAEDAVSEDVALGRISEGRDAIQADHAAFLGTLSDAAVRITSVFAAEGRAAAEWHVTGAYTGQIPGLPPGAGQMISIRGASIIELEGGQIVRVNDYAMALTLLIQIGVVPPPPVEAPPAATPADS